MRTDSIQIKGSSTGVAIDIMRGGLALMVLLAHVLETAPHLSGPFTMPAWLRHSVGNGSFWVNGFFVLSGFCIHRSIMAQRKRVPDFFVPYALARITRLYPLYLLALALALLIGGWPGAGVASAHLTMLQGITGTVPGTGPAWSLTYEAAYYIAWPLALGACGWRAGRGLLLAAAGSFVAGLALFAFWKSAHGGRADSAVLAAALIAAKFPLWLGGAGLAQHWASAEKFARPWLALSSLLWVLVCYGAHAGALHSGCSTTTLLACNGLALPGWLGLIVGCSACPRLNAASPVASWLGHLSYPLYILHQPLLLLATTSAAFLGLSVPPITAAVLLAASVMVFMVAVGVPLETGLLRWRAKLLRDGHHPRLRSATA